MAESPSCLVWDAYFSDKTYFGSLNSKVLNGKLHEAVRNIYRQVCGGFLFLYDTDSNIGRLVMKVMK